jgi:hypothetical protein
MASSWALTSHVHALTARRPHAQGAVPLMLRRNAIEISNVRILKTRAAAKEDACELASSTEPVPSSPPTTDGQPPLAERMLPRPPDLRGKSPRSSWNATALAFMGDAVWEVGSAWEPARKWSLLLPAC